jgi:hypothetical protein
VNIEIVELLEELRKYGLLMTGQERADTAKKKLKHLLTDQEWFAISNSHSSYLQIGYRGFYKVIGDLISKYRGGGEPPLRNGKSFI